MTGTTYIIATRRDRDVMAFDSLAHAEKFRKEHEARLKSPLLIYKQTVQRELVA